MKIKFEGENCPDCERLSTFMQEYNYEVDKTVNINNVDNEGMILASQFNIMSVPALVEVENNTPQKAVFGFNPEKIKMFFEDK